MPYSTQLFVFLTPRIPYAIVSYREAIKLFFKHPFFITQLSDLFFKAVDLMN
jgi:hypothetical protein